MNEVFSDKVIEFGKSLPEAKPIADAQPETLEGFNHKGLHIGSAKRMKSGRWHVTLTHIQDQKTAEDILQAFGATKLVPHLGMK